MYTAQRDDLHAGRTPRAVADGELMVKDLCNNFLNAKQRAGELCQLNLDNYKRATDRMVKLFGARRLINDLRPDDFAELRAALARQNGPTRLSNEVQHAARGSPRPKTGVARKGLSFYSLRHTLRTVADAAKDTSAISLVMGHSDDTIDANYTHGIDDARLLAVSEFVRTWLFGAAAAPPAQADNSRPALRIVG